MSSLSRNVFVMKRASYLVVLNTLILMSNQHHWKRTLAREKLDEEGSSPFLFLKREDNHTWKGHQIHYIISFLIRFSFGQLCFHSPLIPVLFSFLYNDGDEQLAFFLLFFLSKNFPHTFPEKAFLPSCFCRCKKVKARERERRRKLPPGKGKKSWKRKKKKA